MFDTPHYVPFPVASQSPDPLGLATANTSLYRQVFPGINNRARYIRVYSALCWMVEQIWNTLSDDSTDEDIKAAFESGLQKIQLLLVWGNTRRKVPTLPGSQRVWPADDEPGTLSFAGMPTKAAYKLLAEDEDSETKDGATLLAPDEYAPSATNGLGFLIRDEHLEGVYRTSEAGAVLAAAFEGHLVATLPQALSWLRDPHKVEASASKVDELYEVLRLDAPTKVEQSAFAAQYFPGSLGPLTSRETVQRYLGLTLALRAIAAEQSITPAQNRFIDVDHIRHAMARGLASDGTSLTTSDLVETRRLWQSLQVRQYLKLALETLFRVCEHQIRHAVTKNYALDETGNRVWASRDIGDIAQKVGELAKSNFPGQQGVSIEELLTTNFPAKGQIPSLYVAGASSTDLDIRSNLAELKRLSTFTQSSGKEGLAAGGALYALLWCAVEAHYLPAESLDEHGDRLSFALLKVLTDEFSKASPAEFVATIARDYVINLHFDVVRERTEDDINARKTPKDRYRILVGDYGLEPGLNRREALSKPFVLEDVLLHALYFMTQIGLLLQKEKGRKEFRLTAEGERRAAQHVPDRGIL
ncbi:hypothetical protein [Cupriavidus basilensis]|uniref:Uncharacterized protein n=1 Tax=Cupriavidus basilensis TaxID=68895 RepID=A0A0C4YPN1_9BURK|nr:hypothetical protein [Cupriavidus basilensis]AJG25008.1 hypothetical protein RR42_s3432 [Cupriavidus basilensis]